MAGNIKHERSYLNLAGMEKDRSARVVSRESTLFKDGIRRNRMNTIEQTIRSYREANPRTRIDLFMQHRDLRRVFDAVEGEEVSRGGETDPVRKTHRTKAVEAARSFRRFVKWCGSFGS